MGKPVIEKNGTLATCITNTSKANLGDTHTCVPCIYVHLYHITSNIALGVFVMRVTNYQPW